MKLILSPAKSLDFENAPIMSSLSNPFFINQTQVLIKSLSKLKAKKIAQLMDVSPAIAQLNYERFQTWRFPFDATAKASIFVFTGEAYRGLDAQTFSDKELQVANNKLFILSGLYGVLKPFDAVLPYRLEMSTKHAFTTKHNSLYTFWGNQLQDYVVNNMEPNEVLINLASTEYSKALKLEKMPRKVIHCHFKENKNESYKTIMTFAKKARGLMARFIVQNEINEVKHLQAFDSEGYVFNKNMSTENDFVFTRK